MNNVVCLSGWSYPPQAMAGLYEDAYLADYRGYEHTEAFLSSLAVTHGKVRALVGWSLGGAIAVTAIARGFIQAEFLVLIAAPYRFVQPPSQGGGELEEAMSPELFAEFRKNYMASPERTLKSFEWLVNKGGEGVPPVSPEAHGFSLLWLDELAGFSAASYNLRDFPPTLLIYGKEDAIVPPVQAEYYAKSLTNAQTRMLTPCSHAPHFCQRDTVIQHISSFIR